MSFVLCSNPEKENSYHVTNAAIKLVRVVLEVGLREAKEFVDELTNNGIQTTTDEGYIEILKRFAGACVEIVEPEVVDEYGPEFDVYFNGEYISKSKYEAMCKQANEFYKRLPENLKIHVDTLIHMHQIIPSA